MKKPKIFWSKREKSAEKRARLVADAIGKKRRRESNGHNPPAGKKGLGP